MSWFGGGENENDENDGSSDLEGEENENDFKSYEDQIIFLIDAREGMKGKNSKKNEMHLVNSLKVACAVIKSKIIASSKASGSFM